MSCFFEALKSTKEYETLRFDIDRLRLPIGILGLSQVHKAHLVSTVVNDCAPRCAIIITADDSSASRLSKDINEFGIKCSVFPSDDIALRPSEGKSMEFEHERLSVLGSILDGETNIVVSSIEAAMQFTVPPEELIKKRFFLKAGNESNLDETISKLLSIGYTLSEQVEGSGQFAHRGGILDLFSPSCKNPYRIEFWGDTIDSISVFDVETQRRIEQIDSITVTPAKEICCTDNDLLETIKSFNNGIKGKGSAKVKESLNTDIAKLENGISLASTDRYLPLIYTDGATVFDYFDNPLIFVSESFSVKERGNAYLQLFHDELRAFTQEGIVCKGLDKYVLEWSDILSIYKSPGVIFLDNLTRGSFDVPIKDLITFNARQLTPWNGTMSVLVDDLKAIDFKKYSVVICAGTQKSSKALADDLANEGFGTIYLEKAPQFPVKGKILVLSGGFSSGFEYPGICFSVITYGSRAALPIKKKKSIKGAAAFNSLEELHKGDYIVHSAHGIGIFEGITQLDADGNIKDYIKIRYDKGDILYVPITQLDQVSKYIGPKTENSNVKLNKLGGKEWEKTRTRVRTAVKDIAKDLIELYSKRMQIQGFAFSPDIDMQNDFERRFEFDETDDQLRCINEIKNDMEKSYPMDRLLCGDVGFGKTEVALRAAFKCIADGKQCAILVPTTILALQHYQTICKRFEGFPIEAKMISRFVNAKDQKQIKTDLKRGYIDLIVGTHRLISKDIQFKDLGLMIIDEEQRFGVAQKEKLKSAFPGVDVLTLTATPIPRTLNMAMSGIRDMSVLEEAPQDRHPVQTYVIEHNMEVLVQAMSNELRRGGQVYYLHNRTETITKTAARIQELMPDAKIKYAHGQMTEDKLSDIWRSVLEGETDILVCTTIIETGIDVPNVNTLIVENADKMGLAQLHQLRGRVGRSSRRASAYFTFTRGKELSEIAAKRLTAIREYTEFGSGFRIAMRDLELRGAGNILGAQQHGHMDAVGYDMYIKMLNRAISEEKGEITEAPEKECLIDLPIDAHIPSEYISNLPQKLAIYRRIADIKNRDDAQDVIDEMIDRFGDPPESVQGLITVALLRSTALEQGVYEIGRAGNTIRFFIENLEMEKIKRLAKYLPKRITVAAGGKPHIAIKVHPGENQLQLIKMALEIMGKDSKT